MADERCVECERKATTSCPFCKAQLCLECALCGHAYPGDMYCIRTGVRA